MKPTEGPPLILNERHTAETHSRWIKQRNRRWPNQEEDIPDDWINEQCGQCCYFITLEGPIGGDWGVCSNPQSVFDGKAMFEHDGCDQYSGASEWVGSFLQLQTEQATGL